MNQHDLKHELLVQWATPAFADKAVLRRLELKSLCFLIDNIINENVSKNAKFLIKNGTFIEETEKTIKNSVKVPE